MERIAIGARSPTANRGPRQAGAEGELLAWIAQQLKLAAMALKTQPLSGRDRPQALRSGMPEIARTRADVWEAQLGLTDEQRRDMAAMINLACVVSTTEQIEALDRVISWMFWLDQGQRIVLLGRALGVARAKLARKVGRDRSTVWRWEHEALRIIADKLAQQLVAKAMPRARRVSR